jgi:hypothetical protein
MDAESTIVVVRPDRTCSICGKSFKYPRGLREHQKRKTPCTPIINTEDLPQDHKNDPDLSRKQCTFCGRVLSCYNSMRRHVRESCPIAPNLKNGADGMMLLYEHTLRKREEMIERQQSQIEQQQKQITQILSTSTLIMGDVVRGNKTVVNQTQEIHITYNVFGSECLDHISKGRVREALANAAQIPCAKRAVALLADELGRAIWCDPEHPENCTAFLPNVNKPRVIVRVGDKWESMSKAAVIPRMHRKVADVAFDKQPFDLAGARAAGPVLRELESSEKTGRLPGSVYENVLVSARALARTN